MSAENLGELITETLNVFEAKRKPIEERIHMLTQHRDALNEELEGLDRQHEALGLVVSELRVQKRQLDGLADYERSKTT